MDSLDHTVIPAVMAVMDFLGIGSMDLAGTERSCNSPAYSAEVGVGWAAFLMVDVLFAPHIFPAWFVLQISVALIWEKHAYG